MCSTRIDNLKVGMVYWVDIRWNRYNTVRNDEPIHFIGKFVRLEYVWGETMTYPSGLIMMCEPNRTDVIFQDMNGNERIVSSMNKFYKQYRPSLFDILQKTNILQLRRYIPSELRRIITSFCGGSKEIKSIRRSNPRSINDINIAFSK